MVFAQFSGTHMAGQFVRVAVGLSGVVRAKKRQHNAPAKSHKHEELFSVSHNDTPVYRKSCSAFQIRCDRDQ